MSGRQKCFPIFVHMEFELLENLTFVNVDIEYLQKLHNISNEVYYNKHNYDNKPYIGVLLSKENYKYVVPLTSGKEKHKKWKDEENDRILITEVIEKNRLNKDDVWLTYNGNTTLVNPVKHIISAIDFKKMIPILDSVISIVDIKHKENDSLSEKMYKDLLNKEYRFCVSIIDKLLKKANYVYEKQTKTKKGLKFCCDFKALEKFVGQYK